MALIPNNLGLVLHAVLTNVDVIERHATDADPVCLLTLEAEAEIFVVLCPAQFAGSAQEQHLSRLVGTRVQLPVLPSPCVLLLADHRLKTVSSS